MSYTTREALLPCPFCGGHEGLSVDGSIARYVYCNGCDAAGPVYGNTPDEPAAIAAWNQRATPTEVEALRGEVERLKAEAAAIRAQERERCALMAERSPSLSPRHIAAAIRALGDAP